MTTGETRTTRGFTASDVVTWQRDGGVIIPDLFDADEVQRVQADFEIVFGRGHGGTHAKIAKKAGEIGRFNDSQFALFGPVPFECSPALNLAGLHPKLLAMAKVALGCDNILLYQSVVWAKFTGHADYDQPFHCDFPTHTLTVPADGDVGAITFACYFSDVTEEHGPTHYVPRTASLKVARPEETLMADPARDRKLASIARSAAATAGSVFAFAMDTYHRGTNLTAPNAHRYTIFSSFKRANNHAIGYHAWPFHDMRPWRCIFDHATPEQLACFGIPRPGDPFWNDRTIAQLAMRYPGWSSAPYRAAMSAGA